MDPTTDVQLFKDIFIPLAAIATALIIPILSERLKHFFFYPKLEVVFRYNNEFIKETPDKSDDNSIIYKAIYYRLCIRNLSSNSAKNVQMYLISISYLDHNNKLIDILSDPLELVWSYRDEKPIDVPGQMFFFFDLFKLSTEYPKRFSIRTRKKPHSLWDYNEKGGTFLFRISIGFENNYKPLYYDVYINFDHDRDGFLKCDSIRLERHKFDLKSVSVFKENRKLVKH